jgi:predicted MFS family arabinose efflux permease
MAFGPLSTALAYVSDLVVKKYRTQALGMLLGEMFCGIIIGPPLSKLFENSKTNAMLACVFATIALVSGWIESFFCKNKLEFDYQRIF